LGGRKGQRGAAVGLGFGQSIDHPHGVDPGQPFQGEGRAGTVAQQPLQAGAVVPGNPHRRVEGKTTVLPTEHVLGVRRLQQPAAGKPPQHPSAHLGGDGREPLWRQGGGWSELDLTVGAAHEHPVDDTAMEMDVTVQGRAEPVDKADRPEPRARGGHGTGLPQVVLDQPQKDVEHGTERPGLALQVPAQALGRREDPLAHR
jgi:hypothetical protein